MDKIVNRLRDELTSSARAAMAAHAEATDPQSKAENKYDTRGLEAAYLAGAQSRQAAETQSAIELFEKMPLKTFEEKDPIDLSALVELKSPAERTFYFIGPAKGGLEIQQGDKEIVVITPQAPLGRELMGRRRGDRFKWGTGRAAVDLVIVGVS
ncbi:MAG TPA: transcription elongation factor GreAB [Verrucomicrobiae bacterium]|nr:transcription elongation factor GreAB [Verrucomicrobiae bacterium]